MSRAKIITCDACGGQANEPEDRPARRGEAWAHVFVETLPKQAHNTRALDLCPACHAALTVWLDSRRSRRGDAA